MGFLAGKKALIVGVASDRSIASGIAEAFAREGAEIAFTYQNDKLQGRVQKLADRLGQDGDLLFPCDVTSDEQIDAVFAGLGKHWDGLDILVHSVGFAPREQLAGGFTESITREGYAISHDISAYSLAALAKSALPMMQGRDGAILTMTYDAATKVVPNYNVMGLAKASLESCMRFLAADLGPHGIRVNAISAGAVKTLAAAGIGGFRKMQHYAVKAAPLRRTVTIEEIGNTAAFLCSDLASGITGETTFVDAGVNIMGMVFDE
ncbi:MAG: enoyl-ACP reductase [Gammaproteobacteria bacterium]|nr:enoyl-ACP reductase [Gammaproteobacteria bacterium]NNF49174.1 enoyl-ACP reductase [Woeseiaceae bacterium]MBT8094016.1 enoyl-ACP reductase [Gammaproteobacteria bacterium]MBT8103991.1 enoyl-ACP reductase [Gammaproteobacteria bacterium]NNK24006.1 enoyl-ACP reductase [Woeseiaceae bacterium]